MESKLKMQGQFYFGKKSCVTLCNYRKRVCNGLRVSNMQVSNGQRVSNGKWGKIEIHFKICQSFTWRSEHQLAFLTACTFGNRQDLLNMTAEVRNSSNVTKLVKSTIKDWPLVCVFTSYL